MNLDFLNTPISKIDLDGLANLNTALSLYNSGRKTEAIEFINKVLNLKPNNYHLYNFRGTIHEDNGANTAAENDFKRSLEIEPNNMMGAYRFGMICSSKKDFDNAVRYLKIAFLKSSELDTDSLGMGKDNIFFVAKKVIASNLANFLSQIGDFHSSIKYADIAISLDPNYGNPYMAKGASLAQLGKTPEAISALSNAKRLGIANAERFIDYLRGSQ